MKKILRTMTLVLMVFVLTGCMKINMNFEVHADKTYTMGMEMLASPAYLQQANLDADTMYEQMSEQYISTSEAADVKIAPLTKTINGEEWTGLTLEYTATEEESKQFISEKDGNIVFTLDTQELSSGMPTDSIDTSGFSSAALKASGLEMNVTVKMPGAATSNYGEVNGDTVTIDLLELSLSGISDNVVITSTTESNSIMTYALIGVGAIIIIGVVLFILKKKKKPEETVEETETIKEEPVEEPTATQDQ